MHMSNALERRSRLLLACYLLVSIFSEDVLVEARGGRGGGGRGHSSARGSSSGGHSSLWYGRSSWSSAHIYGIGGAEKWNWEQIQLFFIACGVVLLILGCPMMFCGDGEEGVEKPRIQESPDTLDQSFLRFDKGSIA